MPSHLLPAQLRGARGMLDWSMMDLAKAAGVSVSTVKRMETAEEHPLSTEIRRAVWDAFTRAGVLFLDDEGEGVGMRLRQR